MDNDDHILFAVKLDHNGGGTDLALEHVSEEIQSKNLSWVHMDATHDASRAWIEREVPYLDHLIIDALLAEETSPRMIEHNNGVLLILRGINLNENEAPEDMVSLRIWIDPERIISLQRRELKAVKDVYGALIKAKGPKNAGDFITMLLSRLYDRMEPTLIDLDNQLDDLEQKVMEEPSELERNDISQIRKKTIIFRRYIFPQREILNHLKRTEMEWLDLTQRRHIQESWDRVTRYIEDLDAIRERTMIVTEELNTFLSSGMNRNMYVLSIISLIFLPLGFLTGLLGINVGGIPGADNPYAFALFLLILCGIILIQIAILKKSRWI
tara:strand:+ start:126842 stop:127819 length:978 start_codon:yes stop_codon:yes gene_type:complete